MVNIITTVLKDYDTGPENDSDLSRGPSRHLIDLRLLCPQSLLFTAKDPDAAVSPGRKMLRHWAQETQSPEKFLWLQVPGAGARTLHLSIAEMNALPGRPVGKGQELTPEKRGVY